MASELLTDFVKTPYGKFELTVSKHGLVKLDFPVSVKKASKTRVVLSTEEKHVLRRAKSFLRKYFSGFSIKSNQIPIDWTIFRPFDQRIFMELLKVKPGKTTTYGELAKKSHFPRAARAVGNALNRNPIPILIPCHRVLRKDSSLGGYRGGSRWKCLLLKIDRSHSN